ncbi:MAG: hypothetical protein ACOZE7_19770 [Pseudomonadota bacterium]
MGAKPTENGTVKQHTSQAIATNVVRLPNTDNQINACAKPHDRAVASRIQGMASDNDTPPPPASNTAPRPVPKGTNQVAER